MKNQKTPFAAYLAELPEWDKTPRLETLFTGYLGADNTLFNKKAAELLGIAAVARAECPGIVWNHVPVLVGKQGIKKSIFLKALFSPAKVAEIWQPFMSDRDWAATIKGFTCVELCCLPHLNDKTAESLRNFINRREDTYRENYGHKMYANLRECVFVGTTNVMGELADPTGNGRVWEINAKIAEIDIDALVQERDQIWAEAKHLWQLAVVAAGDKCSIDLDAMAVNLPARTEGQNV